MTMSEKKNKSGVIVMICNIVIMIANYVIQLVSSNSDTVAMIAEKVTNVIC